MNCFLSAEMNENMQQLIRFRMNCEELARGAQLCAPKWIQRNKKWDDLCAFDSLQEIPIENRDFGYFPRIGLDSVKLSDRFRYFRLSLMHDCENMQTLKIYIEFQNLQKKEQIRDFDWF